jgi:hypothetical protein
LYDETKHILYFACRQGKYNIMSSRKKEEERGSRKEKEKQGTEQKNNKTKASKTKGKN